MKNYLVYIPSENYTTRLIGVRNVIDELPLILSRFDQFTSLTNSMLKQELQENSLEYYGIYTFEYEPADNFAVLFKREPEKSYLTSSFKYRDVLEECYKKLNPNVSGLQLIKFSDEDLEKELSDVEIVEL